MAKIPESRYLTVWLDKEPAEYNVTKLFFERERDERKDVRSQWEERGDLSCFAEGYARCMMKLQSGGGVGELTGDYKPRDPRQFYGHYDVEIPETHLREAIVNVAWGKVVDKAQRAVESDMDDRAQWAYIAMLARALKIPGKRLIVRGRQEVYRGTERRYRLEESLAKWRERFPSAV